MNIVNENNIRDNIKRKITSELIEKDSFVNRCDTQSEIINDLFYTLMDEIDDTLHSIKID